MYDFIAVGAGNARAIIIVGQQMQLTTGQSRRRWNGQRHVLLKVHSPVLCHVDNVTDGQESGQRTIDTLRFLQEQSTDRFHLNDHCTNDRLCEREVASFDLGY